MERSIAKSVRIVRSTFRPDAHGCSSLRIAISEVAHRRAERLRRVAVEERDLDRHAGSGFFLVIPVLVLTLLAQRGLLRGLTAGAVKG